MCDNVTEVFIYQLRNSSSNKEVFCIPLSLHMAVAILTLPIFFSFHFIYFKSGSLNKLELTEATGLAGQWVTDFFLQLLSILVLGADFLLQLYNTDKK